MATAGPTGRHDQMALGEHQVLSEAHVLFNIRIDKVNT
jgi:hypothetical protein